MINSIADCTILNNGVEMPWLGFGVFEMKEGDETERSVESALEAGYRSFDTAAIYKNELSLGKAIKASSVPREELFITTKVWNSNQRNGTTLEAFEESMEKLQLDYLDLYLVHWPVKEKYVDTWKAMEKLYQDGVVRAIGISNFQIHHLEDILANCQVKPTINQVEYHPVLGQVELRKFCRENQIQMQAWAPLMQGQAFDMPEFAEIAQAYNKSVAQLLIRWDLQNEVVTIPKSSTPHRIVENSQVFDFYISDEDMARIGGLNEERRVGPHPDTFDF